MDVLPFSPLLQVFAVTALVLLGGLFVNRRYQRCPHCGRIVARAHRGWLRCRGCGRQYHRSVQLRR